MRKFFVLLVICFLTFKIEIVLSYGLNSIHTPDGINVIAVGDEGKVHRSSNSGINWSLLTYTSYNLRSVFSLDNDVWFAGDNGVLFKTIKTNAPIYSFYIGSSFSINSIYFLNSQIGYICGDGGKVFKSVNGGANWTSSATGIGAEDLNGINFLDEMKGIVVGDSGKMYLTNDGGMTWISQTSGVNRNLLKAKYYSDGIFVVGEYGIILSKESTGVWQSIETRTDSDIRGVSGVAYNNTHVCGGGGFIRNNRNGRSNFFNFEINPMLANLVDIFFYNETMGFAVSSLNNAIIKTTNGGTNWELTAVASVTFNWVPKSPSSSGIGNNLCMHPSERNTAYVVYGNKVYVSRDRGDNWTQIATISIGTRAHSFYVTQLDTNVWIAAIESSPDKVVRSTDYGLTWSTILSYNFSSYGQPLEMDQNISGTFYFAPDGSSTGFFKSTDNGATFSTVSSGNPFTSPCDIITMWDSSEVLFVGDDGADIYKSSNNGVNWTLVKPNSSSKVPSMCNTVFEQSNCYATTWGSSQVYKTTNFGNNWNVISNNSGSGWASDICHEDPTVVLTGNYGTQAYLSTNGGANFFNINSGLGGAGAGMMVPERGWMLNMQTGTLYKLNINYSTILVPWDTTTQYTPALISPPNLTVNLPTTINFQWTRTSNSLAYWFQLSTDSLFAELIVNDSMSTDSFKTVNNLNTQRKYFWRVGSKYSSGYVYFSQSFQFTTHASPTIALSIKMMNEGLYYPLFNQLSRRDTAVVYLRNATAPYNIRDSAKGVIDSLSFSNTFTFNNINSGRYYIVVKHFQSIETWSRAGGDSLVANGVTQYYDFTTSASQAYGNNLKYKGGKYCIISGDTYQDGFIDGSDLLIIDNDVYNFATGRFLISDVNGDGYTDAADMQIADNNRSREVIRP